VPLSILYFNSSHFKTKVHAKSTSRFLHNFDEYENEVGSIFEKYTASCTIHCIVK
jgi:hypothetical protein